MAQSLQRQLIETVAYQIWEEEGCPDGRAEAHWAEAERRLSAESSSESPADQSRTRAAEQHGLDGYLNLKEPQQHVGSAPAGKAKRANQPRQPARPSH
jgi:hypothetical protein